MWQVEKLNSMIKKSIKKDSTFKNLAVRLVAKRLLNTYTKAKGEPEEFFDREVNKFVVGSNKFKKEVVNDCIHMMCEKI